MSEFRSLPNQTAAVESQPSAQTRWLMRILRVALFIVLTAISAKLTIQLAGNPVPITAQTFVVLSAGLVLGVREGAASQIGYLILIAIGLPIDAYGVGAAAFVSPTAGYLVAFVIGAALAGFGAGRNLPIRIGAALLGAAAIHVFGIIGLTGVFQSFSKAVTADSAFIPVDFGKALLAAVMFYAGASGLSASGFKAIWGNNAR